MIHYLVCYGLLDVDLLANHLLEYLVEVTHLPLLGLTQRLSLQLYLLVLLMVLAPEVHARIIYSLLIDHLLLWTVF